MNVAFGILGPTALEIGGGLQENWSTPRVQALLATLLVHAGQSVSITTLMEWAWPTERPIPQNPGATFHTYATRIRRCLQKSSYPSTLYASNRGYRLDVDKSLIDHHQFRTLVNQARRNIRDGEPERAVEYVERALALWRGRPLADLSSDAAEAWRAGVVRDEWLPANVILLEALLATGEFDQVLARLNELQADHSNDVGLAKLRMTALHGMARSSEATAYYFRVRHRLLDENDDQGANHLRQHHESLRTDASTPKSGRAKEVPAPPRHLPRDVAEFVGRVDLLRELDAATVPTGRHGQVVILDGMAGVGKTAAAVHWGRLARQRFPDGDLFANLNGFSAGAAVSRSTVVDDFLTSLGHPPDDTLTLRSRELLLSRLLSDRRCLVILDNARNTAHVQGLIDLLSSSVIIVTSRQRLSTLSAATGARRVRVPPMSHAESVDLLTTRLGRHQHIEHEDRLRLVRPCGGLPLIVTLLAEHVASMSSVQLSAFARQLDSRQLITDIGEDGDGSTVAHTFFDWSYRALDPPERRLFRRLGLHPSPDIGIDLACVCDGRTPAETKRSLGILLGAHVLERPDEFDRYRFHDLLHEFAANRAERDESPVALRAAARRISSYYLATATRAHQTLYPGKPVAPELSDEEVVEPTAFDNVEQARFWLDRERSNLIAVVHRGAAQGNHDHAWRLADTVATYLNRLGAYEDSRTIRELAVTSASAAGDREATASSQAGLGMVLTDLGEYEQARRHLNASLRFAEDNGNERGKASVLFHLGRLEMSGGNPTAAAEFLERCLEVARRTDDHEALCWALCSLGEALHALRKHDAALTHLHEGLFHARHAGDRSAHAANLSNIAAIYQDRGDYVAAIAYCEQALVDLDDTPNMTITIEVYLRLAEIDLERGKAEVALRRLRQTMEIAQDAHNARAEARILELRGNAHAVMGDTANAVEVWRRAADLHHEVGNTARSAVLRAHIRGAPPGDGKPGQLPSREAGWQ